MQDNRVSATLRQKQPRRPWPLHRKILLAVGGVYILYEFGDMLLPLLGDLLEELLPILEESTQLALESLELLADNFFEHTLHFSQRMSEVFTVWSGIVLGSILGFFIVRAIARRILYAYLNAANWYRRQVADFRYWRQNLSEADKVILGAAFLVILAMIVLSII